MKNYYTYTYLTSVIIFSFLLMFSSCQTKQNNEIAPANLDGTWELVGYQINGVLDKGNNEVQENPVIEFKQGAYGGSTPHNAYAGSYTLLKGQQLVLSPPSSTLASETQWGVKFLESLSKASVYSIDKQLLYISLKDTDVQIVFKRR